MIGINRISPVRWSEVYHKHSDKKHDYFEMFFQPYKDKAVEFLSADKKENEILLDIGCGAGEMLKVFDSLGFFTIGIDLNFNYLRSYKFRSRKVHGDINFLPFKTGSINKIYCSSVFQYCDHDVLLNEIRRVLKPDGKFVMIENMGQNFLTQFYRYVHKKGKLSYEQFQVPVKYINWQYLMRLKKIFPHSSFYPFFLTAMLPAYMFWLSPINRFLHLVLYGYYRLLYISDETLLRIIPSFAKYYWRVLIFINLREEIS